MKYKQNPTSMSKRRLNNNNNNNNNNNSDNNGFHVGSNSQNDFNNSNTRNNTNLNTDSSHNNNNNNSDEHGKTRQCANGDDSLFDPKTTPLFGHEQPNRLTPSRRQPSLSSSSPTR